MKAETKSRKADLKILRNLVMFLLLSLFFVLPFISFAGHFEDLGVAARPLGMGNAFTALANDATSIYYNPAGLALLRNVEFIAAYDRLYMGLTDGSNIGGGFAALAFPFEKIGTIGIAWLNLNLVNYYQENTFTFSYGIEVLPSLYIGANIKLLTQIFGEDEYTRIDKMFNEKGYKSMAVSGDFGVLFRFAKSYSVAFTVTDFAEPNLGLKDVDKVPMGVKLGFAYRISSLDLVTDFAYKEKDWDVYVGAEKWFFDRSFAVRGGLGIGNRENRNIALGGSYNTSNLQVDYAFIYPLTGILNTYGSHRISLTMRFGEVIPESEVEFEDIRVHMQKELEEVKKEADSAKETVATLIERITVLEKEKEAKPKEISNQKDIMVLKKLLDETTKQLDAATVLAEKANKRVKEAEQKLAQRPVITKIIEKKAEEQPKETVEERPKTYTVQEGDTLESIAEKIYNDKSRWFDIYKANKEKIKRGSLTTGQILILP